MDEPQGPDGGAGGRGGQIGAQPAPDSPPPPPPPAQPAPSGWAVNQPAPERQTYWGDAEPPKPPPPPGTEYAGIGRRFLAFLIDLVPLTLITVAVLVPVGIALLDTFGDLASNPRPSRAEAQAMFLAAFSAAMPGFTSASALISIGAIAYIAGTWLAFGRSPGMALLGIRIVREEDGGRPGLGRVSVRYVGYLLGSAVLLIGFIWAIFDSRKQAWHDKLAGTLVVRDAPREEMSADPATVTDAVGTPRRPSIGALTDTAWTWYRRSPDDLLSSLAFVLIPTTIVMLPLLAAVFAATQDQTRESMNAMLAMFSNPSDPAAMAAYNARNLAATAPIFAIGAVAALVGGFFGTIILGACAAAYPNDTSAGPAPNVGRTVAGRLRPLAAIGLVAGMAGALSFLLIGLPAIDAASTPGGMPDVALVAVVAIGLLIGIPAGFYFSVIWVVAVVAIVRENIGAVEAVRRARALARHRVRWLLGVLLVTGLVLSVIVLPVGMLPISLMSEAYLDGQRLPVVFAISTTGALMLFTYPALFLVYVEAYRAAVDDAVRVPSPG